MLNILVIGSGGREHALCWKIKQSPLVGALFCAPGNPGIAQSARCVSLPSHADILAFCRKESIGLVVIGPEQPLIEGLADALEAQAIPVFGPSAKAAMLEGSKGFTKDLCKKYRIPTAAYESFTDAAAAHRYIRTQGTPIVVKADGLAAGKGVTVAMSEAEAIAAVDACFGGAFGAAGASVVIEAFMEGEEASFFALCDGERAVAFASAQDHKRAYDGDRGPNTGGMGTYSPVPVMSAAMEARVMEEIILPTMRAMQAEGTPFKGVLFAGLMITQEGPQLIEYNARFGDPETQSMMMRLRSDLVPVLLACAQGDVSRATLEFDPRSALCVVMASNGYPGDYVKNTVIRGLSDAASLPDTMIFHAGTAEKDGQIVATGGRVLGVTALGETAAQAQKNAYRAVDAIDWPEGFCRRDIGWRAT